MGEAGIVVIALVVLGALLIAPFAAIVMAYQARRDVGRLAQAVSELGLRLSRAEQWLHHLAGQRAPAASVEVSRDAAPVPVATADFAALSAAREPAPVPVATADFATPYAVHEPATVEGAAALPPTASSFDWEKLVGVRLFAWLGGLGLFGGAAFFLQYTIEHDLISPPLRVGIGLLVGAFAVALGDYLRSKADGAGQALAGAGVAILYASLFAARALYALIPAEAAFAAMALVTALSSFIAVRRAAFVLAVIGLVGGFATPALLSTGGDARYALFAYIALLDLGILAVAAIRRWSILAALALAGTCLIFVGWAARYLDASKAPFALAVAALLGALMVASDFWRHRRHESTDRLWRGVSFAAIGGVFLAALFINLSDQRGELPLVCGFLALLLAGTCAVAARWQQPFLLEAATVLSIATMIRSEERDVSSLATLSIVPATLFASYLLARGHAVGASVRRSAAIALLGSLLLLATSTPPASGIMPVLLLGAYVGLHVAGLVAMGFAESSALWWLGGQGLWVGALFVLHSWYTAARLGEFLPLVVAPMLIFFALPLLARPRHHERLGWIAGSAALVAHGAFLYAFARGAWSDASLGAIALTLAALAIAMLARARRAAGEARSDAVLAAVGGMALLFVAAAVPIALDKQWITVAWGLEAAALAWLFLRVPHRGLLAASALLALSTTARLLVNPALWEYHPRSGAVVFNWYLYTFGLPALSFFAAAFLLRDRPVARRYRYPMALWFAGGALVFALLNVEIADAYSTGDAIGVHIGASLGEDMTYSLSWVAFGLAILLVGIAIGSVKARLSALLVLLLAVGKVFLHDLWHLGALYRVGSMMGLAAALLAVSFLTQRFVFRGGQR